MTDERYDRSADMRLLELQREAIGAAPRVLGSTYYTDADALADLAPDDDDGSDQTAVQSGSIVVATVDAQPRTGLIAGALVTLSLVVTNEGDSPASGVRISVPLPVDTAFRNGSLSIDGAAVSDATANDVFGDGIDIGELTPRARRTFTAKIVIEAGLSDIIVSPHVSARTGAVLGSRAQRLTRGQAPVRAQTIERPFYESDADEHANEPLAPRATISDTSLLQPPEYPIVPTVPQTAAVPAEPASAKPRAKAKAAPKPRAKAKPKSPAPAARVESVSETVAPPGRRPARGSGARERDAAPPPSSAVPVASNAPPAPVPSVVPTVRSVPAPVNVPVAGRGGPLLTRTIDRKRVVTLARLFNGPSLGTIAHYLLLNALATPTALRADGDDRAIADFIDAHQQWLSRTLVAIRLRKAPNHAGSGASLPVLPPAVAARTEPTAVAMVEPGAVLLVRAYAANEMDFLARTLANAKTPDPLKAAQLAVGLCANDVAIADENERRRAGQALTFYGAMATAEISRMFLQSKLSPNAPLLKPTESAFDDAAKGAIAALYECVR